MFERILESERVHHGRKHAHVVGGCAVHALCRAGEAAKDIAAADDNGHRAAGVHGLGHVACNAFGNRHVDPISALAHERLAGNLQQEPFVFDVLARRHCCSSIA